jgi:Ras-related protein Rab-7A
MSNRESTGNVFKVVLLGDTMVGKTSLLVRFVDDSWDRVMDPTIGQTFLKSVLQVNNEEVTLHLWDTPGQERYASSNIITIRDANCCIIVYDVSDADSKSYKLIPSIIERYKAACTSLGAFVVIVGNKCDLIGSDHQEAELQRLEDQHDDFRLKSFLSSAKTGENVSDVFRFVASKLLEGTSTRLIEESAPQLDIAKKKPKEKSGCCSKQ